MAQNQPNDFQFLASPFSWPILVVSRRNFFICPENEGNNSLLELLLACLAPVFVLHQIRNKLEIGQARIFCWKLIKQRKIEHFLRILVVPGEGLEPTSLLRAEDFKSSASANSATPACYLRINKQYYNTFISQFLYRSLVS